MNLSDFVLNFLLKKKVDKVFLITGGAISFLVDSFSRNKKIKYISVAHEQAAAMMADSYSRVGPNFSCTMATSGPGATNLLTGIALCALLDQITETAVFAVWESLANCTEPFQCFTRRCIWN